MSTLLEIIEKKKAGKINSKSADTFYSDVLGMDIKVEKRSMSLYMDIVTKYDLESGKSGQNPVPMMNELIYEHCPMFKDVDGAKEAKEFYNVARPIDLPEYVFESNLKEMTQLVEVITNLYGMDTLDEDIKN